MKLINTLSILIFLFLAVACSSESDSVMNDIDNTNDAPASKEVVAAFNISLTGNSTQTRANDNEDATDAEKKITSCFIAAVSEDQVLSSFKATDPSSINMLVKISDAYQPTLTFVAITNISEATITELLGKSTLSSIKEVTFTESPENLVKVGYSTISDYTLNDKKTDITIALTQRTASVELESFSVNGKEAAVQSLELVNVKSETLVKGEKSTDKYLSLAKSIEDGYKGVRLYAYENTSEQHTALKINYIDENGVSLSRTYEIKTDDIAQVVAGKLYKLSVKISPSENDLTISVKDWRLNRINIGEIMPD